MFHWRGLQTKLLCNPLFLAELAELAELVELVR